MATVRDLLKLRNTVQGITISDSFEGSLPVFKIGFRPSRSGLGESQIGRNYSESRQFPKTADGYKRAIAYFKQLKSKYKDEIAKFPENRSVGSKQILTNYTEQKKKFSQELVDEIKKLTKQKKYKTFTQVENALYKTFNKPKYTVAKSIDPKVVFFNPKTKIFTIPRDFEVYGAPFGKRKPDGIKNAIRQIIGTQFFANNPNYSKQREYLTKFYTDSDYKPTDAERNLMRKFVKDFTITRSIASDQGGSIIKNFFRDLNFDFSRKLKDVGKIFNLAEHLKEQIKNPRVSAADKNFFKRELTSLQNDNNTLLKRLKEKFPGLFTSKAVQGGSLQLEHKIARALGETGPLKLPKSYIAKATRVPGRFNQAKYQVFDKPLLKLVTEYKAASKSKKPEIKLEIEKLKNNFNRRTGGYLDSLKFNFGNTVKITDSTPLVSQVKGPSLLFDIDKNIKQSNRFFGSLGEQRVPGLPKAASASDFITSGKEYNAFRKLVNTVKSLPKKDQLEYCSYLSRGGLPGNCAAAIDNNPVKAAQVFDQAPATSNAMTKVKNAATAFLKFAGKGKAFAITAGVGAGAGALVKQFRNDEPDTYLSNENQMKAMLVDTFEEDTLGKAGIGGELAAAGLAVPGSGALYKARRGKGFGAVRSALGPVGKAASGFATPLGMALTTPFYIANQIRQGDSLEDIATNPLNYLAPAFAGSLTREATRGMNPQGILAKGLRLGMSPAGVRGISKFFGLPGLALSLGYEGYDQYKKYQEGEGFLYNLLNKDE